MIYFVEDDKNIRELVVYTLKSSGFEAVGCQDGTELFAQLDEKAAELILMDIMLPGEDGVILLERIKSGVKTAHIPVIMVTARSSEYDKVIGLDSGADDYITKPFGMMELVARVRAVLRRGELKHDEPVYECGGVALNSAQRVVAVDGVETNLTYKEFELLRYLFENKGIVLSRDRILEAVWGYDFAGETRTVDAHIRSLRHKLGTGGDIIETVRGVGYKIGV